jgi:hypothetical protein
MICPAQADGRWSSGPALAGSSTRHEHAICIVKGEPDDGIRARCYERATLLGPFDTGVQRGVRIAESVRL